MANMLATFARLERRLISQRTREALAVKKASGVRLGRPPTLPQTVVRRIQRQRARGDSLRKIADDLNEAKVATAQGGAQWYAATVRQVLLRTSEAGHREHRPPLPLNRHYRRGTPDPGMTTGFAAVGSRTRFAARDSRRTRGRFAGARRADHRGAPVVSAEVCLAAGYATFLIAGAFGLEWLSAHTHRRAVRYRTAAFAYVADLDHWLCPEGEQPWPHELDRERRMVRYRARAQVCNTCPAKHRCTDSMDGREIVRPLDPWPHRDHK